MKKQNCARPLRRDEPIGVINTLAEPSQGLTVISFGDALKIAQSISRVYLQIGVVLPFFRIASTEIQRLHAEGLLVPQQPVAAANIETDQ